MPLGIASRTGVMSCAPAIPMLASRQSKHEMPRS